MERRREACALSTTWWKAWFDSRHIQTWRARSSISETPTSVPSLTWRASSSGLWAVPSGSSFCRCRPRIPDAGVRTSRRPGECSAGPRESLSRRASGGCGTGTLSGLAGHEPVATTCRVAAHLPRSGGCGVLPVLVVCSRPDREPAALLPVYLCCLVLCHPHDRQLVGPRARGAPTAPPSCSGPGGGRDHNSRSRRADGDLPHDPPRHGSDSVPPCDIS